MADTEPISITDDLTKPGSSRLVLSGRLNVDSAKQLHQAARAVLARSGDVSVCCVGLESLHAAVVQILLCLSHDLAQCGRRCVVTGGGATDDALRLGGLVFA